MWSWSIPPSSSWPTTHCACGNPLSAPGRLRGVIGGKVLDASALAALVRGRLSAIAWFATAKAMGLTFYLPSLALAEVRAVRPGHQCPLVGRTINRR
jgi:hypothetical protein